MVPVACEVGAQQVISAIPLAACSAASRDYVFDDPEL